MTFDPITTAARILAERKRLNLTREQAADRCENLTKHGIRNLEIEADPKLSTLIELVANVGMRLDVIAPELLATIRTGRRVEREPKRKTKGE